MPYIKVGLKIYTTLDLDMQKAAEHAMAKCLLTTLTATELSSHKARCWRFELRPVSSKQWLAAGAMISSIAPSKQKRQPGSAFKPFVYLAAI